MNPKEYMAEAECLRKRIKRKENEIALLRQRAEGMTSGGNSDEPKNETPNLHKLETAVCKILALEEELKAIRGELETLIQSMKAEIEKINDSDARDLLTKRYIEFKPWNTIICEMSYCRAHVFRMHNTALDMMKKMIPNET